MVASRSSSADSSPVGTRASVRSRKETTSWARNWTSTSPSGEHSSTIATASAGVVETGPHVHVAVAGGLDETVGEQRPGEGPADRARRVRNTSATAKGSRGS